MKIAIRLFGAILLASFFSSCTNVSSSLDSQAQLNTIIDQSGWKVSWYFDNNKDETSDYSGYTLFFESDGSLRVELSDGSTYKGNWFKTTDDGLPRLVIEIGGSKKIEDLSDDWVIDQMTENKIELKDDNPTKVEELYLEKR